MQGSEVPQEAEANALELEDYDPNFGQYGANEVDFNEYVDAESLSRMGKTFTAGFMLGGNKGLLRKPQNDKLPAWEQAGSGREGDAKPAQELTSDQVKMPAKQKTAVNRLLRHLKKAKIQSFHYEEAQKRKTRNVEKSRQGGGAQITGMDRMPSQHVSISGKPGYSTARGKHQGPAGLIDSESAYKTSGRPSSKSRAGVNFGQQLSRKERDVTEKSQGGEEQPSVGHYHPQFGLVSKRPRTHQFSCIGKFDTSGQQRPTQDPVRVPRAFEEQL